MSIKLREKKLADGRRHLYLDMYHAGVRKYEFLNLYLTKDSKHNKETREFAEKIRAQRQLDFDAERHGFVSSTKRNASFIEYYAHAASSRKGSTAVVWNNAKNHLIAYGGESLRFSDITKEWITGFKTYLLNKSGLSQNSARHYFEKVKTALNQAVADGIITRNPFVSVKNIETLETERQYATFEELQVLAKTPCQNDVVRRAFFFSVYTGLRKVDIAAIDKRDVHGDRLALRQEKTDDMVYIELSPMALSLMGNLEGAGRVFDLPDGATISRVMKRWVAASKLGKHLTFHCARHTFATLALTNGVDIYTVSKLLGHRDLTTTQVYAKIVDEKKRTAVNSLPSVSLE